MTDLEIQQHSSASDTEKRLAFERRLTETRTVARACALQALYTFDVLRFIRGDDYFLAALKNNVSIEQTVMDVCQGVEYFYQNVFFADKGAEEWRKRVDEKYFWTIVRQYLSDLPAIEVTIEKCLNVPWTLTKLSRPVRISVCAAAAELKYNLKTNEKILISAYVDLTGEFCTLAQTGFVNGVLDKLAKSYFRRS